MMTICMAICTVAFIVAEIIVVMQKEYGLEDLSFLFIVLSIASFIGLMLSFAI